MNKILSKGSLLCVLALAALGAAPAAAQTEIVKTDWEVSKVQGKTRLPFAAVTELRADPSAKFTDRLQAQVTLRNNSVKDMEGLVLRYALRLRLLKKDDPQEKAFWGVPFSVDEVRVTAVKAKSERVVRIVNLELAAQLRKLRASGFAPTALKMEIMIGPRLGDDPAAIIRESVIEILKPQP